MACHALLNAMSSRTKSPELPSVLYGTVTVLPTDFTGCQRSGRASDPLSWKVDLLGAKCPRVLTYAVYEDCNQTQQLVHMAGKADAAPAACV